MYIKKFKGCILFLFTLNLATALTSFYIMKHIEQSTINKVFCSAEMNSAICFVLLYSVWDQNSRQGQKENNKCR